MVVGLPPVPALGLPIAFALTGGEVSDYKGYLPVMDADGPAPKVLLADKGYDADFIREDMKKRGNAHLAHAGPNPNVCGAVRRICLPCVLDKPRAPGARRH